MSGKENICYNRTILTSMQLYRVKFLGLMSTILHADDFATPSTFFGETWISHMVKARMDSCSAGLSFFICIRRVSSSQKLSALPLRSSNENSSRRAPLSMLVEPLSNEYIFTTGPPSVIVEISDNRFVGMPFWFFLYGAEDHPAWRGLMIVRR